MRKKDTKSKRKQNHFPRMRLHIYKNFYMNFERLDRGNRYLIVEEVFCEI